MSAEYLAQIDQLAEELKEVKKIIKKKVDTNFADDNQWTALHFAVQNSSFKMVKLLLKYGANPNFQDSNGNTTIFKALMNFDGQDNGIVKILKDYGGGPYLKNNFGISPIDLAKQITNYNLKQFFPGEFS